MAQTLPPAVADAGALNTERPGFTIPSAPVGLGVLQMESGNTYEWALQEGSKLRTFTGLQTLVRFGVTSALEVRYTANGYAWQTELLGTQRANPAGGAGYSIGAKYRLFQQKDLRPEVAVIGSISMPAAGSVFSTPRHDPSLTLAASKDLPKKLNLALNANFASTSDDKGRIFNSGEGAWLTRSMKPVSVFVEVFHTTIARGLGSEVIADFGIYRNIGKYAQFDFEGGHTIYGDRPSLFTSAGIVIRAPQPFLGPERYRFGR